MRKRSKCWWDLADYDDCYFPWGGLVDANYRPKPAYHRLQDLVHRRGRRTPGFGNCLTRPDPTAMLYAENGRDKHLRE